MFCVQTTGDRSGFAVKCIKAERLARRQRPGGCGHSRKEGVHPCRSRERKEAGLSCTTLKEGQAGGQVRAAEPW